MKTPAGRITTALQKHAEDSGVADVAALDIMASRALADFFGTLFEIDQRLKAEEKRKDAYAPEHHECLDKLNKT